MPVKNLVSIGELRATLAYDSETGVFTWRHARRGVRAGSVAGTTDPNGYRYVAVNQVYYLAHRLAWFYVHGEWPSSRLSFRDGSTQNCAICNILELGYEHGTRHKPLLTEEEKRKRTKDRDRRNGLQKTFGLSVAEYQTRHDAQDGKCAICGQPETETRDGKVKWLAVDHDHATDAIRDLLCAACNVSLGKMQDDPSRLRAAAAYLDRHAALAAEEAA